MKVVILCGGQGTRIRDAHETLPKPMLPIGGRPILWHIMRTFAHFGHTEFVLCLGYGAWHIRQFFLNYRTMMGDITVSLGSGDVAVHGRSDEDAWRVTLAETGEHAMTGARVAAIRQYIGESEPFFLTYGDGVASINVARLLEFHREHGRTATVTAVRPPGRFGEMTIRAGRVAEFNEKPQTSEGFINGGFFVLDSPRIWPFLQGDESLIFEKEPLQQLARKGELVAFEHTGFWMPMDTTREYQLLNEMWRTDRAPWRV